MGLEDRSEDHSVCSYTVVYSLGPEREIYTQRAFLQAPPTAPQLANRQRGARLRALTFAKALPHQTFGLV